MRHLSKIREQTWVRVYKCDALTEQGGRCAYCREPLRPSQATGDHVIPRIEGGTTNFKNIKAACEPCNKLKGRMGAKKFMNFVHQPPEDHPKRHFYLMANARWRIFRRGMLAERRIMRAVS